MKNFTPQAKPAAHLPPPLRMGASPWRRLRGKHADEKLQRSSARRYLTQAEAQASEPGRRAAASGLVAPRPRGPTRTLSLRGAVSAAVAGHLGGRRCTEPCGPVRRCEALLCLVPRARVPRANALQQIRFQFSPMGGFRSLHIEHIVTDRGCLSTSSTLTVL